MEELFGFGWWEVGVVVVLLLGFLWFVTVVEQGKRRHEIRRYERHNR
jgi:hypothetical protein